MHTRIYFRKLRRKNSSKSYLIKTVSTVNKFRSNLYWGISQAVFIDKVWSAWYRVHYGTPKVYVNDNVIIFEYVAILGRSQTKG